MYSSSSFSEEPLETGDDWNALSLFLRLGERDRGRVGRLVPGTLDEWCLATGGCHVTFTPLKTRRTSPTKTLPSVCSDCSASSPDAARSFEFDVPIVKCFELLVTCRINSLLHLYVFLLFSKYLVPCTNFYVDDGAVGKVVTELA